ncbi:MAG: UDP-N-acetylmuramoyl-L-alanyl-D-glutamate--2,6-diaminopimelate ligase [Oscillospiraceae bacterium]
MKLKTLLQDVPVLAWKADPELEISDISYDSRTTKPGELFVAVTGFESDGHRFIGSAVEKGAAVVLCEREPDCAVPYILVENTRAGLALASRNYFGNPAAEMRVIGVTGTNGKTTTTMLVKHMLERQRGAKVGLIGTNQNMIGDRVVPTERTTPESYELQKLFREMVEDGCSYCVMEVSSHSLELDRVTGIQFAVGVFTNLTQDHLDFHKTMENYAKAKAKLFGHCDSCSINLDDDWAQVMIDGATCPVMTYSAKQDANLFAGQIALSASGVKFNAYHHVDDVAMVPIDLHIPGKFSVSNALSVITIGLQLGLSLDECAEALSDAKGVKGRVEVVPTHSDYTILIDYAHTPDALENVLKSMKEVAEGRVVVLFGCGGDRDRTKRPIMGKIASDLADFVIVTSDNPRTEDPAAIVAEVAAGIPENGAPHVIIEDREQAIVWAMEHHVPNDLIILAGKGHETYQIIGKTKRHMDEREIVAANLSR